jgi:hypothetical protein
MFRFSCHLSTLTDIPTDQFDSHAIIPLNITAYECPIQLFHGVPSPISSLILGVKGCLIP